MIVGDTPAVCITLSGMGDENDRATDAPRKDRLIQARVPRDLEVTLKQEARRRRLTVSHLIRSVLEDTFQLVDGVVAGVDQIVSDSVHLARAVGRGAPPAEAPGGDLSHVYAWSEVVLHRPVACSQCGAEIARGERGYTSMSDERRAPRAWLCARCIASLPDS